MASLLSLLLTCCRNCRTQKKELHSLYKSSKAVCLAGQKQQIFGISHEKRRTRKQQHWRIVMAAKKERGELICMHMSLEVSLAYLCTLKIFRHKTTTALRVSDL